MLFLWHSGNIQLPPPAMSWTGFATDLTLDDVIGPPRDCVPPPQPARAPTAHRAAQKAPAPPAVGSATPDAIRYYMPPANSGSAAARPQPHVHVTEEMLPPAMRARLPGGRRSNTPWLAVTIALAAVALIAGSLATSTPRAPVEDPVRIPETAYEFSAPSASLPAPADDAAPVEAASSPAVPVKSRKAHARAKDNAPATDANDHVDSGPGDIDIEKFRQLSGKI